jgi:hypothetical protein
MSHPMPRRLAEYAGHWLLPPLVLHCPGAESGRYTEDSPTKRVPSRETSTCSPGLHIYYGKKPGNYNNLIKKSFSFFYIFFFLLSYHICLILILSDNVRKL